MSSKIEYVVVSLDTGDYCIIEAENKEQATYSHPYGCNVLITPLHNTKILKEEDKFAKERRIKKLKKKITELKGEDKNVLQ